MENVKRLIYVSTNPKIVIKNFADLCRPGSKDGTGSVFLPVRAIPVDIFPHTTHCQLVICFERTEISSLPLRKKLPPLIKNLESLRGGRPRGGFANPNMKLRGQFRGNPVPVLAYHQRGLMDMKICPPGTFIDESLRMPAPEFYPLVHPFSYPEFILPRARGFPPSRRLFPPPLPPGLKRQPIVHMPMATPLESLILRQQFLEFPLHRLGQPIRARGMRRGRPYKK
jgi:hypothetical protein